MCVHNFDSSFPFKGFRLNREQMSAHHVEGEVLMMAGMEVVVVGIESFDVKRKHPVFQILRPEDKEITIVYLFNCS